VMKRGGFLAGHSDFFLSNDFGGKAREWFMF
jgi:hypothetical protein